MSDVELRRANVERTRNILERFSPFEPSWLEVLHPDIAMEFPFGESLGYPARIEGREECTKIYQLVSEKLGLTFSNVEVEGMADPNLVLAQYRGSGVFNEIVAYNQRYITVLGFRDEQLVLYREHLDTNVTAETLGHLNAIL